MDENINYKELLLEMLEKKEYTKLRQTAAEMQTADIAAIMDEMEDEDSLKMFRLFPKDMAADVFADLEPDDQQYIIQSLSHKEASTIIDNLMSDDAADLLEDMLEEMPANVVKKILANARPDTRADINLLLQYPEDSAGSIMTVEYVDLRENMTVADAIERAGFRDCQHLLCPG